jgi:diguanylate cyclase (GGDEF)-like protein
MHFVGILALHLDVPIMYNPFISALSMLTAVAISYIAFQFSAGAHKGISRHLIAGLFMGSGIVTMHYTGISAIRSPIQITYNPIYWLLSAVIAFIASYAALYLFRKFRNSTGFSKWKLICAILMGLAICGMHYTGMAAVQLSAASLSSVGETSIFDAINQSRAFMLVFVALSIFFILAMSWGALFFDKNVLERLAFNDALTGQQNRHGLVNYFNDVFSVHTGGFLIFIDLDRFKTINNTMGHDVGDLFIREIAERLRTNVRPGQTLFRLGGDEFLVASSDGNRDEAAQLSESLLLAIKQPYTIMGNEIFMTASLGISLAPDHGTDRTSLLKAADMAMYNAKAAGKNQFMFFDELTDRRLKETCAKR